MPDDRTTGRPIAREAVPTRQVAALAGADRAQQGAEVTERLQAQTIAQLTRLTEEAARVTQQLTTRAGQNAEFLIDLTTASVSGWQQTASELNQQTQQAIELQIRMLTEALSVRRPEDLIELHSRCLIEGLQIQFSTTARLTQITADLTKQATQRLPART